MLRRNLQLGDGFLGFFVFRILRGGALRKLMGYGNGYGHRPDPEEGPEEKEKRAFGFWHLGSQNRILSFTFTSNSPSRFLSLTLTCLFFRAVLPPLLR